MKNKNFLLPILVIVIYLLSLFSPASSYAQNDPPPFDEDVDDEAPPTPIDGLLFEGLILGVAFGYVLTKRILINSKNNA